jgi:cell division protein FtsI/penicillin-binding protein 2
VTLFYSLNLFSLLDLSKGLNTGRGRAVARRGSVIPTLRGEIYDRNYDLQLVMNVDSFAVEIYFLRRA